MNAVDEENYIAKDTDDCNQFQFIEMVPLTSDTDDPCITACDSGDRSDEVKQLNLSVLKQEPDGVWLSNIYVCVKQ